MDEALKGTQNTALATLLNADWLSSGVCCRKVEIFQLEQHLTRRKIRERACSAARPCPAAGTPVPGSGHGRAALQIKSCCAANQILPRRKSNLAAGFLGSKWSGSKPATRLYIHFEWDRAARHLFASFGVNAGQTRACVDRLTRC